MVNYAGFWVRLGAAIIDMLAYLPFMFGYAWLQSLSWEIAVVIVIPFTFLYAGYNVYFHGRWGQTIGKMVMRIQVVRLDMEPITYTKAFLRHAVDFVLSFLTSVAIIRSIFSTPKSEYEILDWMQRGELINKFMPSWYEWINITYTLWICSELIVILFNKRKRALHDYIAGTLVIRLEKEKG